MGIRMVEFTKDRRQDEWSDNLQFYLAKVSDAGIALELRSVC